jgi:hypothetical protein
MVPSCHLRLALLFAPALLAGLGTALAAAPVLGPQIRVNVSTLNVNANPRVAVFPDGSFIVVWNVSAKTGPGANRPVVHARSFHPDGSPASGEFVLLRDAGTWAIAVAGPGRFVLAYNNSLQLFNRFGKALTAPVLVHEAAPDFVDFGFVVAVGADGRIAVAWASGGTAPYPGPCLSNSYARIFSPRLTPLTGTLVLDVGSDSDCSGPQPDAIALTPGGDLFALLTCWCAGDYVYAVRIDGHGESLPAGFVDFDCTGLSDCNTIDASLAAGGDGRLVVLEDYCPPPIIAAGVATPPSGISGQVFDASGDSSLGGLFPVSRHPVGTLTSPQIAWLGESQAFVAVWLADGGQDGIGTDIFGRVLAADGTPLGRDFRVSFPAAPGQDPPALAAGGPHAVAVWTEESTSTVYARSIAVH